MKKFALALALVALCGCSAEQIASEERIAHQALTELAVGIDWATANPAVVKQLLEEARTKTSNPTALSAIDKAEAELENGDMTQARAIVLFGVGLTATPGTHTQ